MVSTAQASASSVGCHGMASPVREDPDPWPLAAAFDMYNMYRGMILRIDSFKGSKGTRADAIDVAFCKRIIAALEACVHRDVVRDERLRFAPTFWRSLVAFVEAGGSCDRHVRFEKAFDACGALLALGQGTPRCCPLGPRSLLSRCEMTAPVMLREREVARVSARVGWFVDAIRVRAVVVAPRRTSLTDDSGRMCQTPPGHHEPCGKH